MACCSPSSSSPPPRSPTATPHTDSWPHCAAASPPSGWSGPTAVTPDGCSSGRKTSSPYTLQLVQVDVVDGPSRQRGIAGTVDVFGSAVAVIVQCAVNHQADLGCHKRLSASARDCPPNQLLVGKRPVRIGRVKQG